MRGYTPTFDVEKLDAANWDSWKIHMQAILEEKNLWEYVTGEKPRPDAGGYSFW